MVLSSIQLNFGLLPNYYPYSIKDVLLKLLKFRCFMKKLICLSMSVFTLLEFEIMTEEKGTQLNVNLLSSSKCSLVDKSVFEIISFTNILYFWPFIKR